MNETTQTMYVRRKIDARSRNHYCGGKAMVNIYHECHCSYSYAACNAHAPYYSVIGGLSVSISFFPNNS